MHVVAVTFRTKGVLDVDFGEFLMAAGLTF